MMADIGDGSSVEKRTCFRDVLYIRMCLSKEATISSPVGRKHRSVAGARSDVENLACGIAARRREMSWIVNVPDVSVVASRLGCNGEKQSFVGREGGVIRVCRCELREIMVIEVEVAAAM